MAKTSTQQPDTTTSVNAFTRKPDTRDWVKKQELSAKKKKGGTARAASLNGDSLNIKLGKNKYK